MTVFRRFQRVLKVACFAFMLCMSSAFAGSTPVTSCNQNQICITYTSGVSAGLCECVDSLDNTNESGTTCLSSDSNFYHIVGKEQTNNVISVECASCSNVIGRLSGTEGYICSGTDSAYSYADVAAAYNSGVPGLGITQCPEGYYCTPGTSTRQVCSGSKWSDAGSTSVDDCYDCPAGYDCYVIYSEVPSVYKVQCPEGNYCLEGSGRTACPAGYWSDAGAESESDCYACPAGYYCNRYGYASKVICPAGSYCPEGSASPGTSCPQGAYCPEGSASPIACEVGTYQQQMSTSSCTACPAGRYCPSEGMTTGSVCPTGSYCPVGSINPTSCPTGYSTTSTSKTTLEDCTETCRAGSYCDGTNGEQRCPAGQWSDAGATSVNDCYACPAGSYCQGRGYKYTCSSGRYCPEGSAEPTVCPAGTFSEAGSTSVNDCHTCPEGYYCNPSTYTRSTCPDGSWSDAGAESESDCYRCPAGYYCSSGVKTACPAGTYRYNTGGSTVNGCSSCSDGYWSDEASTTSLACYACPAGYYCSSGTKTACPAGTYKSSTGGTSVSSCSACSEGEYCPEGSSSGTSCPKGSYCPAGSAEPTLCPAGTYRNSTGGKSVDYCYYCPEGRYCLEGSSSPGPYCPAGTWSNPWAKSIEDCNLDCQEGYYCDETGKHACPSNTWSAAGATSADDCTACPAGYQCNGSGTKSECPVGYYCLAGATAVSCPAGTYRNTSGAASANDCVTCPEGRYCPENGNGYLYPNGVSCYGGKWSEAGSGSASDCYACPPGYYCTSGGSKNICPAGYYCPAGSSEGNTNACPSNTWSEAGSGSASDCYACPSGYYCAYGSKSRCPAGRYCLEGQYQWCSDGQWSDTGSDSADDCYTCPPGYYCRSGSKYNCRAGSYCPEGSGSSSIPFGTYCPAGTWSEAGSDSADDCTVCPDGYSCAYGSQNECQAGSYCQGGSSKSCPIGKYCPAGSVTPIACPAGWSTTTSNARSLEDCSVECPEGYYCDGTGRQFCPDGTWSEAGSDSVDDCTACPPGYSCRNGYKGECPAGYYCPDGQLYPCPAGTWSENGAQSIEDCDLECQAGYYCDGTGYKGGCPIGTYGEAGAASISDCHACPGGTWNNQARATSCNDCPEGNYCPEGSRSSGTNCPAGKWSDAGMAGSADDCYACPAGYRCNYGYKYECSAGYYCPEGSSSSTSCPAGNYCPAGSAAPTACPAGTTSSGYSQSLSDCAACSAGQYCPGGVASSTCPKGYYCPAGAAPVICPEGTYNPNTGRSVSEACYVCNYGKWSEAGSDSADDCTACPAGYYCNNGSKNECWAGYYCPGNLGSSDGYSCPVGKYCPKGSATPTACPAGWSTSSHAKSSLEDCNVECQEGYYCDGTGRYSCPAGKWSESGSDSADDCTACPAGYYCANGSKTASPAGRYCPENSRYLQDCSYCPVRTWSDAGMAGSESDCYDCPAGYACGYGSQSECWAGYYCPERSLSTAEKDCPAGSYCPAASGAPTPCPDGTYGYYENASSEDSCIACSYGYESNEDHTGCVPIQHNIYYVLNGGDWDYYGGNNNNPSTYGYSSTTSITYEPQRSGYVFLGWCDDEELTQNCDKYRYINSSGYLNNYGYVDSDITLYAKWELQQTTCPAGQYAYFGSDIQCEDCAENCNKCEPGYYCTGKKIDGGDVLTANDNGRYECPESRANSNKGATSLADCKLKCPEADFGKDSPLNNNFGAVWYDLNGDGMESMDECVLSVYGVSDEMEMEKCAMKLQMTDAELQAGMGDDYYTYGFDKPCDYNKVNFGLMTCRYSSMDESYTDCSEMVAGCSDADLQSIMTVVMQQDGDSKDIVDIELDKKGLNKNTIDWDDFFVQNLAGVDSYDDIARYNTCEPEGYKYCPETQYYSVSAADCVDCTAGSYCVGGLYATDSEEDAGIEACSGDTFSGAKAASCTQCPVGVSTANQNHTSCVCTNNDFTYDSEMNICYVDSCDSGNNICCDPGYYVMETESTEATNCWRCYEKGDDCDYCGQSSACWDCYKRDDNACDTCYDYIASLSKSFGCEECESGYYCPGIVEPIVNATDGDGEIVCEDGYFSDSKQAVCTACPAGATSNNDHTECDCPVGYEWNSSNNTCEINECPSTRMVEQFYGESYTKWDIDACYTNGGLLIEGATEEECHAGFEWRNNKCVLAGTDKEVPDITTRFSCEYVYEDNVMIKTPVWVDLDGNGKISSMDTECVLFMMTAGDPETENDAEADRRFSACRYNATTHDYTDCSTTWGICSVEELIEGAQTDEEYNTTALNNAKTKVGAASWDAFFNRDFASASYMSLIDDANGVITREIINQDSFSMCCPAGQYMLNDNGAVACETCPNGSYCPGGAYETSATAGAMQCPNGATVNLEQTGCDCPMGYTWSYDTNTCVFSGCPSVSIGDPNNGYVVSGSGYKDMGGVNPVLHFLYDFDNDGEDITDCMTVVLKADDYTQDPSSAEDIKGISFCRYDAGNYTNCATPLRTCSDDELEGFMYAFNHEGAAGAFNIFTDFSGKQSPSDLTFGNSLSSLTSANNCLICPAPTKTFDVTTTMTSFIDLNGDNVASADECVTLAISSADATEARKCMRGQNCDWETAELKLFACRYDTQDYNDCSEALSFCDESDMQTISDVPETESQSVMYLALLRNMRTKMGLSNTNPDWNNDFFTVDMSSQSTITDAIVSEHATNCISCPVNTEEKVSLADGYVDLSAMESSFLFPYDFDNDGKSFGDCVKMVAQWDMQNSKLPTAISYCKYDTDAETYFGSCTTPVPTCTYEDLGALVETNDLLGAFATQANVQSPSDLSFNQSGANLDSGVVCPIQCPSDGDPDGVGGGFLIKDAEYVESLSSCAKAYIWTDNDLYKMAVCKYNTDTKKYDICADQTFTACTAAQVAVLSSASKKTSDMVQYINDTYTTTVGTDVNSITEISSLKRCPCESGYEWNSSKYMCEFTTCPTTRIVKKWQNASNIWNVDTCYDNDGNPVEGITTEAECIEDYEWRDNKCFVSGTNKEVPGIITEFGCEYEFDRAHVNGTPLLADIDGNRTNTIDECVLFMLAAGNPQAQSQSEQDMRLAACRYNTTTKDYTDCSTTLGLCTINDLMAMAEGAQTDGEMFIAILRNAKTKVGAATWDAFYGRDLTDADNTTLIRNANGMITHTILNQDSFSMCCPEGQYLLNDDGAVACDTCPSEPANMYCSGGVYETSATAGAAQCPEGATVNLEQTGCDCSALGGRYHWVADTNTCDACPLGSYWDALNETCEVVNCPKPQQSYTNPSPIDQNGGPGVAEVSTESMRKSYGATENECTVMRIYYENGTPLLNGQTIENYIAAGSSVAFCRYDSNTGSYDNKCTQKYTLCEDENAEEFAAAGQTNGVVSFMQYLLDVDTEEEIAALFTENSADLESETAINRCCPDGFVCCSAGTYIDYDAIGTDDQCPICPAGSYCEGKQWDPETTFASGETKCGTGTYNATPGAKSVAACLTCPADYPLSTLGTTDIAQCYANCPQSPACVANALGCAYTNQNQTTKTFGNTCGTSITGCKGGYTATNIGSFGDKMDTDSCSLGLPADQTCQLKHMLSDGTDESIWMTPGQFAVGFYDELITSYRGVVSCNGTVGNDTSVTARISNGSFVPTANGANCWIKVSQIGGMEVNASWVYVKTYSDEASCEQACGRISSGDLGQSTSDDVLSALTMTMSQNQVCAANVVNIAWDGVAEPGDAGMCTYGKDLITPQVKPEQAGKLFLGWKPVLITNNENDLENNEFFTGNGE